MAKSVNKVIILGNVGRNPEIKTTNGDMVIANFSVATSERYKDSNGDWKEKSEWHNLIAFKRTAEIVRDYVTKGSKVYIEGKLQTSSWDDKQSGQKRYRTEIIVNDLVLLTERPDSEPRQSSTYSAPKETYAQEDAIPF